MNDSFIGKATHPGQLPRVSKQDGAWRPSKRESPRSRVAVTVVPSQVKNEDSTQIPLAKLIQDRAANNVKEIIERVKKKNEGLPDVPGSKKTPEFKTDIREKKLGEDLSPDLSFLGKDLKDLSKKGGKDDEMDKLTERLAQKSSLSDLSPDLTLLDKKNKKKLDTSLPGVKLMLEEKEKEEKGKKREDMAKLLERSYNQQMQDTKGKGKKKDSLNTSSEEKLKQTQEVKKV